MQHRNPSGACIACMHTPCRPWPPCRASPLSLALQTWPWCPSSPPCLPTPPSNRRCRGRRRSSPEIARPKSPSMPLVSLVARHRRPLATRRATTSSTPWTPCEYLDHHRDTATPLDTLSTTTRTRRRRRSQPWSAAGATDLEGTRHNQALPDHAVATIRLAWTRRTSPCPRLAR
jgi:hypothetical protein